MIIYDYGSGLTENVTDTSYKKNRKLGPNYIFDKSNSEKSGKSKKFEFSFDTMKTETSKKWFLKNF